METESFHRSKNNSKATIRSTSTSRLSKSFRPLGSSRWDIILGSLTINVLSLALPIVLLQIYDRILPNEAIGTLSLLIFGLGVALILEALLRQGRSHLTSWAGAKLGGGD